MTFCLRPVSVRVVFDHAAQLPGFGLGAAVSCRSHIVGGHRLSDGLTFGEFHLRNRSIRLGVEDMPLKSTVFLLSKPLQFFLSSAKEYPQKNAIAVKIAVSAVKDTLLQYKQMLLMLWQRKRTFIPFRTPKVHRFTGACLIQDEIDEYITHEYITNSVVLMYTEKNTIFSKFSYI